MEIDDIEFLCQYCCKDPWWECGFVIEDGEVWVYCEKCDGWTSHPFPENWK